MAPPPNSKVMGKLPLNLDSKVLGFRGDLSYRSILAYSPDLEISAIVPAIWPSRIRSINVLIEVDLVRF